MTRALKRAARLLPTMSRALRISAAAAVCAVGLAACGSSGASDGDSATTTAGASADRFDGLSGTVTWYETAGGSATDARKEVVFPAFTDETGVAARGDFNADSTKLFAAMEQGGKLPWNVIEFPAVGDFLKAKEQNQLVPLDTKVVPVDKLLPGTYDKYGIRYERYGIVIAWNTEVWPESGQHPTSLVDIFDTQKFPGKRCLLNYPEYGATLESALLADGVARDDLYPLDVDRALAKLDTIKDDVVWYDRDAAKLLASGECDLAITWSGQIFTAVTRDHAPLAISWVDGMYAEGVLGIPKDAEDIPAAQAMLAFLILDAKSRDEFTRRTAYPMPVKGVDYPEDVDRWLAVGKDLMPENAEYYRDHIAELAPKFTKWLGS